MTEQAQVMYRISTDDGFCIRDSRDKLIRELLNQAGTPLEIYLCPICGEKHDNEEDSAQCCIAAACEFDDEGDLVSYTLKSTLKNKIEEVEITHVAYWKPNKEASPTIHSPDEVRALVKKHGGYGTIEWLQGDHCIRREMTR